MLAIALVVMLGQCSKDTECKGDRVCVDGQCVSEQLAPRRQQDPKVEQLLEQRPALYWPISELILGAVLAAVGPTLYLVSGDSRWVAIGLSLSGGALAGGLLSLVTTLWARGRVSSMVDELETHRDPGNHSSH